MSLVSKFMEMMDKKQKKPIRKLLFTLSGKLKAACLDAMTKNGNGLSCPERDVF